MIRYNLFILIFSIMFLSSISALEFVRPDTNVDPFLSLVPNQTYKLTFLSRTMFSDINVINVSCNMVCESPIKDGPYYYINILAPSEGSYDINITYDDNGKIYTDYKKIVSSLKFISYDVLIDSGQQYLTPSKVRFIVTNNSDSDVNLTIGSNLPDKSMKQSNVLLPSKDKTIYDLPFTPLLKGTYDFELRLSVDGMLVSKDRKTIKSDYTLNSVFKSNLNSYPIISSSRNLFASIRSIFVWLF